MIALTTLAPFLAAAIAFALAVWLERATRRPELAIAVIGVIVLVGGVADFIRRPGWFAAVLVLQGIGFLHLYRWRRGVVMGERAGALGT